MNLTCGISPTHVGRDGTPNIFYFIINIYEKSYIFLFK